MERRPPRSDQTSPRTGFDETWMELAEAFDARLPPAAEAPAQAEAGPAPPSPGEEAAAPPVEEAAPASAAPPPIDPALQEALLLLASDRQTPARSFRPVRRTTQAYPVLSAPAPSTRSIPAPVLDALVALDDATVAEEPPRPEEPPGTTVLDGSGAPPIGSEAMEIEVVVAAEGPPAPIAAPRPVEIGAPTRAMEEPPPEASALSPPVAGELSGAAAPEPAAGARPPASGESTSVAQVAPPRRARRRPILGIAAAGLALAFAGTLPLLQRARPLQELPPPVGLHGPPPLVTPPPEALPPVPVPTAGVAFGPAAPTPEELVAAGGEREEVQRDEGARDAGRDAALGAQLRELRALLEQPKRRREAQERLLALRAANPKHPEVHIALGDCAQELRRGAEAIGHYQEALRVKPGYPPALFSLAKAYRAEGDPEKALSYFESYIERRPHGPRADRARQEVAKLRQELAGGSGEAAPF